jgi:hypothetical protein
MGVKTHFPARLWNDNYDHLQRRAADEGLSMNAMLNHILKEDRRRHARKIKVISTPSQTPSHR